MTEASTSDTPLRASFQVKLNGESVVIATVGQAYRFITRLNTVEWMEFQLLHDDARAALEAAAENGMMIVQATNAVRALFARAKLLGLEGECGRHPSASSSAPPSSLMLSFPPVNNISSSASPISRDSTAAPPSRAMLAWATR